jgi:RNA polymerase sigma-70 factor (ECF subfamily)
VSYYCADEENVNLAPDSGPSGASPNGNPEEFETIVETYKAGVMSVALNILGNREDAEDVCQETFVQVYRNLERYDRKRSFKTWIFTILCRRCFDQLKKRRRFRTALQRFGQELGQKAAAATSNPCGKRQVPEELLKRLSPRERTALALWANEGYTGAEISEVMGCAPSTVRVCLYNARKRIKSFLEKGHEPLKDY